MPPGNYPLPLEGTFSTASLGVTMADTRPTPISLRRAAALCITVLVAPDRMSAEDARDAEDRKLMEPPPAEREHSAHVVRQFDSECQNLSTWTA